MKTLSALAGTLGWLSLAGWGGSPTWAADAVGKRPYEMDWAGRTSDHCAPLVDFEDLTGWRVECRGAVATLERTREQQIWGSYVGKLTYRGTNNAPEIRLLPPQPIALTKPFDAVSLWCYGNNWGWAPNPNTPQVSLAALFEDSGGREFSVSLYHVDWTEWYLLHKRLRPELIDRAKAGVKFKGLLITNGRNRQDRVIYLDNFAVFAEQFPPLKFEPRPERGIAMFPGQSAGANTGPGKLPFPTTEKTILPDNAVGDFKTSLVADGAGFLFIYTGSDGRLVYVLRPNDGTWSGLTATWEPSLTGKAPPALTEKVVTLKPCVDGGVYLATAKGPVLPQKAESLGTHQKGDTVESRWRLSAEGVSADVTYVYRLWNKSLVIDVLAPGGNVAEVRYGHATGLANARLVTNPFYPTSSGRPAIAVGGSETAPLFLTGNTDWYLSGASTPWAANVIDAKGVTYNGGTRYTPLTDGKRGDCFERFFITVSPRYEEVLPNIPNPMSPWKHVAGTRVWRAHGASNRDHDKQYWENVHRHGITQVIVTDHETLWRDGGESFTFRTKPAPGKGGDQGAYDYARFMQDKLGFVYGPYNNFTDFAPVNEFWNFDMVSRDAQNQLQHAWMRCYAPKPARAVEYCAKLAPQIQEKFKFSTAYCDVHTAVAPWHRVDFDPRVPGAGTFAAVFYSFGEIMLHQKKAWNGPVYSEGNYHCFYMGLTDGNYGQDQSYRPAENPWLVDFDLRKMHDLGCNFGMGNMEMFYANVKQPRGTPEERDAEIDRFLAATVAFGHPGFLVMEGGMSSAMRSYYMLQQLHSRYCLTNAADIRYADAAGALLDTTRAVANDAFKRSQVVTCYADGTITAANGSKSERLVTEAFGRKLDLPPNGYAGWTKDGAIEVLSGDQHGHRADYAATPAYLYVDGRGKFARFDKAAGKGVAACRILPEGKHEVIPLKNAECGFAVNATSAIALDKERKELGPAEVRVARGLTYVMPVKGAFSYLLSRTGPLLVQSALQCDRDQAVPGERVIVRGKERHEVAIPPDVRPGQRLWFQFEGAWIDFTVAPVAEVAAALDDNQLRLTLTSHLPRTEEFMLRVGTRQQPVKLAPLSPTSVTADLGAPADESAEVLAIELVSGALRQKEEIGLRVTREIAPLLPMPTKWAGGMCVRGEKDSIIFDQSGAHVNPGSVESGGVVKKGINMHPPYKGGTGYAFALYEPVKLPANPAAAFRAVVGKGDGSDPGDGILYKLAVIEPFGEEVIVTQTVVTAHAWKPLEADLSRWAGKPLRFKLIADAGPKDNSSGDWAGWAEMRIETLQPRLHRSLVSELEVLRHERGPFPIRGLTLADLRTAKAGWLRYDGRGLEGTGQYATYGVINHVKLGEMKPAHAAEQAGAFARNVGVALSAEALRTLGRGNHFVLQNPNKDFFTVGRFWIELVLADGRKCSSDVSTAVFTQPADWSPGEGIRVPFEREIAAEIWFDLER